MEKPDFPWHMPVQLTFILTVLFIRYWRCDIKGAPSGKLQGKTVAIKDNTCVAGVPMMNGSRILEGFVPDIDATVVSRILDAGGRILGKAVCENLCCSGASFTAATGPVVNPHDKTRMAGGSSSGCAALVRRYRNHFNYNPRDPFFPAIFPLSRYIKKPSEFFQRYGLSNRWGLSVGTVITNETKEPNHRVLPRALLFGCIVSFVVHNRCLGTYRRNRYV